MLIPALIATLLLASPQESQVKKFKIMNTGVQTVFRKLSRTYGSGEQMPRFDKRFPGVDFLSFDPTDNSIVARGPAPSLEKIGNAISLFDVPPFRVNLDVFVDIPEFDYQSRWSFDIASEGRSSIDDPLLSFYFTLKPKISGDGKVALDVNITRFGEHQGFEWTGIEGQSVFFSQGEIGTGTAIARPTKKQMSAVGVRGVWVDERSKRFPDIGTRIWIVVKKVQFVSDLQA